MPLPLCRACDVDAHAVVVAFLKSSHIGELHVDTTRRWRIAGESVGAGKLTLHRDNRTTVLA